MTTKKQRKKQYRHCGDWGSGRAGEAEAGAELGGGFAVAEKAKSAEVVEVALATALGYGADVVGVP
jgi:hypothetical protein